MQNNQVGFVQQLKEQQNKYEKTIKDIETKWSQARETVSELTERINSQSIKFENESDSNAATIR